MITNMWLAAAALTAIILGVVAVFAGWFWLVFRASNGAWWGFVIFIIPFIYLIALGVVHARG